GYEALRPEIANAQGRVHELRGEYPEAIAQYEVGRGLLPNDLGIPQSLGRCHRELGEFDEAVSLFEEVLHISPYNPTANHDLALTYEAMGRPDEARTHLERALEVWSEADEGYGPARQAREALARIGGGPE
ncbi:MAG: tetratricopeptide repeat protein, partial [Gemmatimonadetes bacterium]|nr:tetratricopeptide repeat protein [Gemmatimonadota bacterium]